MPTIISEQTMEIDEELWACFIDKNTYDHVKWTKLMQVLNKTGTEW
jgi:hypothetical protein